MTLYEWSRELERLLTEAEALGTDPPADPEAARGWRMCRAAVMHRWAAHIDLLGKLTPPRRSDPADPPRPPHVTDAESVAGRPVPSGWPYRPDLCRHEAPIEP